jgi:hypothetical protein
MTSKILTLSVVVLFEIGAAHAASVELKPRKWSVTHPPETFAKEVVSSCMTSAKSKISVTDTKIEVTDDPKCTKEIEDLSKLWESDASKPIAAANLKDNSYVQTKRKLKHAMDDLKEGQLEFHAPLKACHCIVMMGARAQEAAGIVRSGDLNEMPDLPDDGTP